MPKLPRWHSCSRERQLSAAGTKVGMWVKICGSEQHLLSPQTHGEAQHPQTEPCGQQGPASHHSCRPKRGLTRQVRPVRWDRASITAAAVH